MICSWCDQSIPNAAAQRHSEICPRKPRAGDLIYYPPSPKPTDRKSQPVFSGVLMYFPDALLAVSEHSKKGNDKHNPGEPMRWAREKSTDQADCIARHLIDIGPNWDAVDPETGSLHAAALAWRALALLQTVLERSKNGEGKK